MSAEWILRYPTSRTRALNRPRDLNSATEELHAEFCDSEHGSRMPSYLGGRLLVAPVTQDKRTQDVSTKVHS